MVRFAFLVPVLVLAACTRGATDESGIPVVDVVARWSGTEHRFDLSQDEVPAGWITFRFRNRSPVEHFALLSRVPDSIGVDRYRAQIARVAQNMLDRFVLGRAPTHPEAGVQIAAWYRDVVAMGGPGLGSPGATFDTTVKLSPGRYVLECHVKTPDGHYHHAIGMLEELRVTGVESGAPSPTHVYRIALRNDGLEAPDTVRAGRVTFVAVFAEQMTYRNLTQNDVHIARVDDGTDLDALAAWLDSMAPGGLVSPDAPATFLGGISESARGSVAYLTVDLVPGRYAWLAEVPEPASRGMLRPFVVIPEP